MEESWNIAAETVLDAIERSGDLTKRGLRGVIAEKSFGATFGGTLPDGLMLEEVSGDTPADYVVQDSIGIIRIQVKLQRSVRFEPLYYNERTAKQRNLAPGPYYVVETQKTRRGSDKTGADTRPYHFGEFDLLAVSMNPSTGNWSDFRLTVANWLLPRPNDPDLLAILQPVAVEPNSDWTDSLVECISWFRGRTIMQICQSGYQSGPTSH